MEMNGLLPQQSRRRCLRQLGAAAATSALASCGYAAGDDASSEANWKRLEAAPWVREGSASAKHVVYVFTDPSCQWCHRLWEASRPWVDSGKVQVRNLFVGFIRPDSAAKVAAILGAADPAAAIAQNERSFTAGGIKPAFAVSQNVRKTLDANESLLREFGFRGTPVIAYRNASGRIDMVSGLPGPDKLPRVMGDA